MDDRIDSIVLYSTVIKKHFCHFLEHFLVNCQKMAGAYELFFQYCSQGFRIKIIGSRSNHTKSILIIYKIIIFIIETFIRDGTKQVTKIRLANRLFTNSRIYPNFHFKLNFQRSHSIKTLQYKI